MISSTCVIDLGSFEVTGGAIRCTDPCYEAGTWCAHEVVAHSGMWEARMVSGRTPFGERVHSLSVRHADDSLHEFKTPAGRLKIFSSTSLKVGVDSGQFGFFDSIRYPLGSTGDFGDPSTFYGRACELTNSDEMAGVLSEGVVSSAGFGDGGYSVNVTRDGDGIAIALEVTFISDDDDENCEEEDGDYNEDLELEADLDLDDLDETDGTVIP